jgi:hypothetical protein
MFRKIGWIVAVLAVAVFVWPARGEPRKDNPKEATGFFGDVVGTVSSRPDDGTSVNLTVEAVSPDPDKSNADAQHMLGQELCIGTRLPRDKDGKPRPSAEDVAWVKTLKPGMKVTIPLFAAKADPNVLRMTKPGSVEKPDSK